MKQSGGGTAAGFVMLAVLGIASAAVAIGFRAGDHHDGGRWRVLAPVPLELGDRAAVWTGTEMLLWGGKGPDGAALTPDNGTWRMLPAVGLRGRQRASGVWTGTEMIVWGGMREDIASDTLALGDGAAYNPATNTWRLLAPSPLSPRWSHQALWTGREMIIWGGQADGDAWDGARTDGAAYDPALDHWRLISSGPDDQVEFREAFWTGHEVVVCCGITGAKGRFLGQMARPFAYNPATDRWRRLAALNFPTAQWVAHWTGDSLLIFGRRPRDAVGDGFAGGAVLDVRRNRWQRFGAPPNGISNDRFGNPLHVWTGTRLVVWGGRNNEGASYDPNADRWLVLPPAPTENLEAWNPAVWTGREMIVWAGHPTSDMRPLQRYSVGLAFTPQAEPRSPGSAKD